GGRLRSTFRIRPRPVKGHRRRHSPRAPVPSARSPTPGRSGVVGPRHCVRTATLVAPRTELPGSLNRTKMGFAVGLKGTLPDAVAKTAKVGVAPAAMTVATEGARTEVQTPVTGFVSQRFSVRGRLAPPRSAETVTDAAAPTLTDATEKTPVP